MNVLFLTASYPVPEHPGAGIFVREHARAAARHAEVAVAHIDRNDHVRTLHVEEGEDDEFLAVRVRYPASPLPLSYLANVTATALAARHLGRRGFDPDVIHAHFFLAGAPAIALGRLLRKPVVITEQWSVFLPDDPMALSPLLRRVARFTFEHADVVMPVSVALRDGIRAIGANAEFRVVPNVVDTDRFHPDGEPPAGGSRRLVGVGNLYPAKGWEDLLDALALVREREDALLDIFGDGELRESLEVQARRLGVEGAVTFHGWRPKEEVAERVRSAELFVMTSRYDSNPCALIEALASGTPAVGTAVGGIPEMISAKSGVLAEAGNPQSIASAIAAALERSWDRAAIADSARARYGAEQVGASFASVYEDVVRRRR